MTLTSPTGGAGTETAAPTTPEQRLALLEARLTALQAERDQVLAETVGTSSGDIADRAVNVEANIRLSLLDERIAGLMDEIDAFKHSDHSDDVVSLGDAVTLDLGDGPETFVVGSVEQAAAGVEVLTPGSPLGKALIGAKVGDTVTYSPRAGVSLDAKVVAVS